jgi:hypothetical protein
MPLHSGIPMLTRYHRELDPWRSASVSSELRPRGPLQNTAEAPIFLIPGARHCNDLIAKNGLFNADVNATQVAEIAQMKIWIADYYKRKGGSGVGRPLH